MLNLLRYILVLALIPYHATAGANDMFAKPPAEKYFNDDKVRPSLYSAHGNDIAKVEYYLNGFVTFSAQFKQSSSASEITYGKLLISKPGKIRCEYFKPSPVLLIINGDRLTYYDKELDEVSYTNSDINALKLLALSNINFKELNLVEMEKDDQFLTLNVKEYSKDLKQDLILTLKFSHPQIVLKQITITTKENVIDMIFDQIAYNSQLSDQLFYFHRQIPRKRR